MKKLLFSFLLTAALFTALLYSGLFGVHVNAEALGLKPYSGWFSTAKAANKEQIRKVCNLAKSQTNSKIGQRVDNILFKAKYRPTDIGGSDWVKNNHGSGLKSVYDPGLETTVTWPWSAWGCCSYALFCSKYVRGSIGSVVSPGKNAVPSVSKIKWLMDTYADPGEHVRYYYKSPSGSNCVHSVVYLASDNYGFYFASENGDNLKISVHYISYSAFHKILRVQSGSNTLMLYDTNGGKDKKDGSTAVATVSVTSKPKPRYTPDTAEYKTSYTRTLSWKGSGTLMTGKDVKYMQACLYYLGYDITIDGKFGSGSSGTVKKFQTHYGLKADGFIGPSTWPAIENAVKNNPKAVTLTIKTQPKNVTVAQDGKATFSVAATGSKLTYQWYFKKSGESSWTLWKGYTTATISVTSNSTWDGMQVYCKVKDSSGKTVNSKNAVVTLIKELKITEQPKNKTVNLGEKITVSLKAQGKGLSYQWYYKKAGNSEWSIWKGRKSASETVTPDESWNGIQLFCKVTDSSGKTIGSSIAVIKVRPEIDTDEQPKG